jgi:type I restriction enzyme M protein
MKPARNKYCQSTDLSNEASVEFFFVMRMLKDLGYVDGEIKPKRSIGELRIPKGSKTELYKPDFLLQIGQAPRWLIDAKSTDEAVDSYTYQCAGYSLQINRKYSSRPLRYYMLTNGLLTRVYVWDQEEPVLSLRFSDFVDGNLKYQALIGLLGADVVRGGWESSAEPEATHLLVRPSMDVVKRTFLKCHKIIWKSEKMSPQAAFVEFSKLLFVKLWEDRKIRDKPDLLARIGKGEPLPASEVRFSSSWLEREMANDANPVDSLLFRQLVNFLENEIAERKRKRIFEPHEKLRLSPGTAKHVVEELEKYYLFGIDEDLNGRMFEAFLGATMRGQELGQYFTPRSIVKMITRLSKLDARPNHIERVLDACCGTGGFLIEALTEMRKQIYANTALSKRERTQMLEEVANEAIFGVDAGRDPVIAKIARINMYLHGDGGSRIYMTDALKKVPEASIADTPEVRGEIVELARALGDGLKFDVALTNPPFSMDYSNAIPEEDAILQTYTLASFEGIKAKSLRSAVMFIERYWDLLRPGGRLLTVIDDSVLSGRKQAYIRRYIREHFIVRAVVSLHGDAFRGSGARVKTSILYLTKKRDSNDTQPSAFVYESRYIGLDDVVPRTRESVAQFARAQAAAEMDQIERGFDEYLRGVEGPWLVPPERLGDRLDAKHLLPWNVSSLAETWNRRAASVETLENLVDPVEDYVSLSPDESYTFLRITYEGQAEAGEKALGREVSYAKVGRTKPGDIVVSNINAVHRATCVIPDDLGDLLTSNEFTVLRLKQGVKADPVYLWSILRSTAIIAEWMSNSSGVGRHRVDWGVLRKQKIPLMSPDKQKSIGDFHRKADRLQREITGYRSAAIEAMKDLDLESAEALDKVDRAKPPK